MTTRAAIRRTASGRRRKRLGAATQAGLACLAFAACPAGARGEVTADGGVPAATPYVDVVRLPPNAGGMVWHRAAGAVTKDETIIELVPDGETDADWSQIITIKTMVPKRDPESVVQGTVALMREVCGNVSVVKTPRTQQMGDVRGMGVSLPMLDVTDMIVTCRDPDLPALRQKLGTDHLSLRRYEVTWYRIMNGQHANYIVQRAWHGDDLDNSVLTSRDVLAEWKTWLTHVTVVRGVGMEGQRVPADGPKQKTSP